jgi:hypothetical protein
LLVFWVTWYSKYVDIVFWKLCVVNIWTFDCFLGDLV